MYSARIQGLEGAKRDNIDFIHGDVASKWDFVTQLIDQLRIKRHHKTKMA